jgi:hypothetical protein
MQEYMIYEAQINPSLESELEVSFIGLVDKPAIEKNFQAFHEHKVKFIVNDEKHMISGPAMIAGLPIYRSDDQLGEYYVLFNKNTIQTIVEKFSSKGYLTNFNLFHDGGAKVSDITIFNSFIVDDALGIKPPANFEDLANGSWFITAKVNNPDIWQKVKTGEIKGFSVEGIFSYMPVAKVKMTAQQMVQKINRILSETEITD